MIFSRSENRRINSRNCFRRVEDGLTTNGFAPEGVNLDSLERR